MHNPHSKPEKGVLKVYRAVYHFFGFQKGYNFPLYFLLVGTLFGFTLARMEFLDFKGTFFQKTIPGEQFWYQAGRRAIGIRIHLIGALFGSLLACFQFTPAIRHKFLWLHRVTGYFAILLLVLANVGAFMILDHAAGGQAVTQVYFGTLGTAVTAGLVLAYINIKRLQIDQHRAWMIRAWSWAASIITLRLILLAATNTMKKYGYHATLPVKCNEIHFMYASLKNIPDSANPTAHLYPLCGTDPATSTTQVLVSSGGKGIESGAVLVRSVFTMAGWLATTIHIFLTELYLWLTPEESYRLRKVSYERQVARGIRKEGDHMDAGIGSTRFGDAPWWWSMPESYKNSERRSEDTQVEGRSGSEDDVEASMKPSNS